MGFKASSKGAAEMRERLKALASSVPEQIARAVYQETQVEATESKKRCPVDKGTLRGTIHVEGPFRDGSRVWALIVAGGPAAPYAIYVHEDLEALHTVGQAKFIESVILESRPYLAARIARRIELNRVP